jgi:2-hydroxychromene-2-carboxylate isomerase
MATIEFFYDYSSPWTYFASERIEDFCARNGANLIWKPFLVGGVFNKVNPTVYQRRENPVPPKDNYYRKDMADWARYLDLKIVRPSVFPVNSVKALRGAFVAIDEGFISGYSKAVFRAYWRDDKDISQDAVLSEIVRSVGMDPDAFFTKITDDTVKRKLFATTDEIIARGGYGTPTFFIDGDDMYFGNDRFELMQAALDRKKSG